MKPKSQYKDSALQIHKVTKPGIFNKAQGSAWSKSFQKGFPVNIITIALLIHIISLIKALLLSEARLTPVLPLTCNIHTQHTCSSDIHVLNSQTK